MKKICLLFGAIILLIIPSCASLYADEVIDQSTPLGGNDYYCGVYAPYVAMGFRPTLNSLTKVEIGLFKDENAYGTVTISIRDRLYGEDLISKTISVDDVPPKDICEWVEFDFDDLQITSAKRYYIVFTQNNGMQPSGNDSTVHWILSPWNPYLKGRPWIQGTILPWLWTPQLLRPLIMNPDLSFRTYGHSP
jgi:hypothetical protein